MKKSGVEGVKGDDDVGKAMTMNCVEIGSKGSSSIKHGWWTSVPACAVTHHHHIPTTAKGQQAMRSTPNPLVFSNIIVLTPFSILFSYRFEVVSATKITIEIKMADIYIRQIKI